MSILSDIIETILYDVTWYCDGCNAVLNNQTGFTTSSGSWECEECGFVNDVTRDNVFRSEEEFQDSIGVPRCPTCGGLVVGDAPSATYWFICPNCNDRFRFEDGELVSVNTRRSSGGRICANCGNSLSGGVYTAAWANGNNSDGYATCPHCGYTNFDWDD